MPSPDEKTNGGPYPRPAPFELNLEPVAPSELDIDVAIPTVEVVSLPPAKSGLGTAIVWCVLFSAIFAGILGTAIAIADWGGSERQKLFLGLKLFAASAATILAIVIYSACRRGFTFGKAFLWCLLFVVVTQGIPAVLISVALVIIKVRGGGEIQAAGADLLNAPQFQSIVQLALLTGQTITIIFSLLILRWAAGKDWKRKIALRLPSWQHVALVLVATPALLVVANAIEMLVVRYVPGVSRFGGSSVEAFVKGTKSWPCGMAVLVIGIGPAIGEELWCRGFLGRGLASRYGNWGSVLLASFFFGAIHVEPPQAVMAFLMGIVFHLSYLATRSIFIPMLIHFLNNTLVVLNLSETGPVPIVTSLETAFEHSPVLALATSILVLLAAGMLVHRTRVRIFMPSGMESPPSLYPHVETPLRASANQAVAGTAPVLELGALLVAAGLFSAVWFGL